MYKFKAIPIYNSPKDLFVAFYILIPKFMWTRNTKNAKNILKRANNEEQLPYQL